MLSKEVCKCCNERFSDVKTSWEESDDELWSEGFVFCPSPFAEGKATFSCRSNQTCSETCPFKFEHMIAGEECS